MSLKLIKELISDVDSNSSAGEHTIVRDQKNANEEGDGNEDINSSGEW